MANVGSAPNAPGRDTQNSRLPRDIRHIVAIASDGLRLVGGDLNVLCGERPGSVIRRIRAVNFCGRARLCVRDSVPFYERRVPYLSLVPSCLDDASRNTLDTLNTVIQIAA